MTAGREDWVARLRDLMEGRPVRWASPAQVVGDYDGRERTLEVFNADSKNQRALLRSLRPFRAELEAVAGGPVIVIFHTTRESARLYGDFVRAALREAAVLDTEVPAYDLPVDVAALAVDIELRKRDGAKVGTGAKELPRVAA